MNRRLVTFEIAVCTILICSAIRATPDQGNDGTLVGAQWPMFGQNIFNSGSNNAEFAIASANVSRLSMKWVATTGGDVSARSAVVDGVVYFPDWGGNLWALNAQTGATIWHHQLSDYGLPPGTVSRTSPAVQNDIVFVGTQQGAYLLAVSGKTGDLRWKTQLDKHPLAIITASPTVLGRIVYTGIASNEEGAAASSTYQCCSFRGSLTAVNATSGRIIWKTYMAPTGYSGASVWGSSPVVDPLRGTVFIGTGNNYSTPTDPEFEVCIADGGSEKDCLSVDDYIDSIVALDLATGKVKWSQRLSDGDDWNVACLSGGANCPHGSGQDYDFGSAPNEFVALTSGGRRTIVGAGQKSGIYSAFDPDTGSLLWASQVGPGSSLGGIEWGTATDGKRVYVAIVNSLHIPYGPNGSWKAGSWAALDPATGTILWQTPDPNGAVDLGPLSVANGVVYAPSMASLPTQNNMYGLDAATGDIKWRFAAGSSVNAGATIVDGVVYWGSGYARFGLGTGNRSFYAFSLDGE